MKWPKLIQLNAGAQRSQYEADWGKYVFGAFEAQKKSFHFFVTIIGCYQEPLLLHPPS